MRLATDPEKCLQIAHKGVGQPAEHHHVCTVHPDYKKIEPLGYKPEEAKKLLAEAGFPDGIDVEINCKPDPSWEQAAVEAMAEQWKAGGIRAKINVLPSAKFWEVWDKVPFGFTEWTHRPLGFMVLALAYRTGVPWNELAYSNKQFDELLGKAEGTLDVDKRREILGELEKIMLEDGPITQPLWRSVYAAYDKRVKASRSIRRSTSSARRWRSSRPSLVAEHTPDRARKLPLAGFSLRLHHMRISEFGRAIFNFPPRPLRSNGRGWPTLLRRSEPTLPGRNEALASRRREAG